MNKSWLDEWCMNGEYTALELNLNSESGNAMLDFSPSIRVF